MPQNLPYLIKKGNCIIVNSLSDLWQKASELSKERMDILDEKLPKYLKSRLTKNAP